jgi:hypothetical protein
MRDRVSLAGAVVADRGNDNISPANRKMSRDQSHDSLDSKASRDQLQDGSAEDDSPVNDGPLISTQTQQPAIHSPAEGTTERTKANLLAQTQQPAEGTAEGTKAVPDSLIDPQVLVTPQRAHTLPDIARSNALTLLQAAKHLDSPDASKHATPPRNSYGLDGPQGPLLFSPLSSPPRTPAPKLTRPPLAQLTLKDGQKRRSVRGQKRTHELDNDTLDVPSSGAWLNDAAKYLQGTCTRLPMGLEMISEYLDFEKSMNYPSKVTCSRLIDYVVPNLLMNTLQAAKNKLANVRQPNAVTSWLSGVRDLYKVPDSVRPVSKFVDALLAWYHALQPRTRQQAWNIEQDFRPPYKILPASPNEWLQLRKAGPNGIFVFIMALSWLTEVNQKEDAIKVEFLMKDFVWVLGTLKQLDRVPGFTAGATQKTNVVKKKTVSSSEKENKKRSLDELAAQNSRKRVKTK